MAKKQTELPEELREAVFEAARAGAAEAYTQNTGYVNYFKAMETLCFRPQQGQGQGKQREARRDRFNRDRIHQGKYGRNQGGTARTA